MFPLTGNLEVLHGLLSGTPETQAPRKRKWMYEATPKTSGERQKVLVRLIKAHVMQKWNNPCMSLKHVRLRPLCPNHHKRTWEMANTWVPQIGEESDSGCVTKSEPSRRLGPSTRTTPHEERRRRGRQAPSTASWTMTTPCRRSRLRSRA